MLGAGLVVLLVWLSVVSRKLIKNSKKLKKDIENISNEFNDYKKELENVINDVYNNSQITSEDIIRSIKDLNIDSRFDKLHNLIKNISTQK